MSKQDITQRKKQLAKDKARLKKDIQSDKEKLVKNKPKDGKFRLFLKDLYRMAVSFICFFGIFIASYVPYYCAAVYEGYSASLPIKNVDAHTLMQRDKLVTFGYAVAAIVTIELTWFMIKVFIRTLHLSDSKVLNKIKKLKIFDWNPTAVKVLKIVLDITLLVIVIVLPQALANSYESTLSYMSIKGLSQFELNHMDKSIDFGYTVAAACVVKFVILLSQRIKYNLIRKKGTSSK